MNRSRLRVELDVTDYFLRDNKADRESLKAYLKGQVFNSLSEGIQEEHKDLLVVDTTKLPLHKIEAELWVFTVEDLLEVLKSPKATQDRLMHLLGAIASDKKVKMYKKELIEFKEL
jgi:hypothetical protein